MGTHRYLKMNLAIVSLLAFVSVCNGYSSHYDSWPYDQRSDPMEKQPGTENKFNEVRETDSFVDGHVNGDDYGLSLRDTQREKCWHPNFPFFYDGNCCDSKSWYPGICCQDL